MAIAESKAAVDEFKQGKQGTVLGRLSQLSSYLPKLKLGRDKSMRAVGWARRLS